MDTQAASTFDLKSIRIQADRLMVVVLWMLAGYSILLGGWHDTYLWAFAVGLPCAIIPTAVARLFPGALITRILVAVAFMIVTALNIHQSQGMIEMHFAVFVLLAFLLCYYDWKPVVAGATVIALH